MPITKVKQFKFEEPADFLKALGGLTHPLFRDYVKQTKKAGTTWLFRGQWNSALALLPKAWREETPERDYWSARLAREGVRDSVREALKHKPEQQEFPFLGDLAFNAMLEYVMTQTFVLEADQLGFSVPEVSHYLPDASRSKLAFAVDYAERFLHKDWAYARGVWCRQAVAYAQHHGIPTRLLDWTVNPFNAAFFAARDAVNSMGTGVTRRGTGGSLVVYVCVEQSLDSPLVPVIRVPQAENLYLRLQGGVFTIDLEAERQFACTGQYSDFATSLRALGKDDVLAAYLLPRKRAPELLEMLRQMGISSATLMPNAEHVAETLGLAWRTGYPQWE
jgi:hypothetical protein